jgi:hypothetical protein
VIETFKIDSKWTPKKKKMVARGNFGKMSKVNTLGENKKHIQ